MAVTSWLFRCHDADADDVNVLKHGTDRWGGWCWGLGARQRRGGSAPPRRSDGSLGCSAAAWIPGPHVMKLKMYGCRSAAEYEDVAFK